MCTRSLASRLDSGSSIRNDVGMAHHRAPERHALALAARKLRRAGARAAARSATARRPRALRRTMPRITPRRRGDRCLTSGSRSHSDSRCIVSGSAMLAATRHVRIQRVALEHHRDAALVRPQVVDRLAVDLDAAGRLRLQPRDDADQRRLAAAGRADQRQEFAVGDVEVDARQHGTPSRRSWRSSCSATRAIALPRYGRCRRARRIDLVQHVVDQKCVEVGDSILHGHRRAVEFVDDGAESLRAGHLRLVGGTDDESRRAAPDIAAAIDDAVVALVQMAARHQRDVDALRTRSQQRRAQARLDRPVAGVGLRRDRRGTAAGAGTTRSRDPCASAIVASSHANCSASCASPEPNSIESRPISRQRSTSCDHQSWPKCRRQRAIRASSTGWCAWPASPTSWLPGTHSTGTPSASAARRNARGPPRGRRHRPSRRRYAR